VNQPWTAADEGLLKGMRLAQYLQNHDRILPNQVSSPLPLQVGEETLCTASAQVMKWTRITVRPETWDRFRFTVKWAQDPLMAPFLWLILLPFNLIFALIARERATQTHEQWTEIGSGYSYLVVTQWGLLLGTSVGTTRIPWEKVTDISTDTSRAGMRVSCEGQHFYFNLQHELCPSIYVASRFLAFHDRTPVLPISQDFLARARVQGRIP
jgi:hypothetical protein